MKTEFNGKIYTGFKRATWLDIAEHSSWYVAIVWISNSIPVIFVAENQQGVDNLKAFCLVSYPENDIKINILRSA